MKKTAGTLKIDQAQFRELEAFAKFGSVDAITAATIDKGRKNVEILKQAEHHPIKVEEQVAIIFCGTNALLKDVPIDKVREFEEIFIANLNANHKDIMDRLAKGELDNSISDVLKKTALEIAKNYKK